MEPKETLSINNDPVAALSKEEVIKILKEENPPINNDQKYRQLILVFEVKKVTGKVGVIKGEYYKEDKLDHRGSLLIPLTAQNLSKPTIFDSLEPGQYKFYGFTLDSREPKTHEKVIGFFKRSFEDSAIQDFIPFLGGKSKE